MTTPHRSGGALPPDPHPRATNVLLGKPLTVLRAARVVATVTIAVTVIAGVLMRVTDALRYPAARRVSALGARALVRFRSREGCCPRRLGARWRSD